MPTRKLIRLRRHKSLGIIMSSERRGAALLFLSAFPLTSAPLLSRLVTVPSNSQRDALELFVSN